MEELSFAKLTLIELIQVSVAMPVLFFLASATILMGKLSPFGGVEFELVAIAFDPDSQLLLLLQCEIRLLATEF